MSEVPESGVGRVDGQNRNEAAGNRPNMQQDEPSQGFVERRAVPRGNDIITKIQDATESVLRRQRGQ